MENIPEKTREFRANGGNIPIYTLGQIHTLASQQEFWSMCATDAQLCDLTNERGDAFSFQTNAISSGFSFIKKTLEKRFYDVLSFINGKFRV